MCLKHIDKQTIRTAISDIEQRSGLKPLCEKKEEVSPSVGGTVMPLPENINAVRALEEVLKPMIIGRELSGWACCCGAVQGADAIAVEIRPGGNTYPGQETEYIFWTVKMKPKPGDTRPGWSCGISTFIPGGELEELFAQHFGEVANR